MPRSKGRASRDETGTWRRGSVDDGQNEPDTFEEVEVPVRPRAPSVPRSVRSRRSKADLSAVAEEPLSPTGVERRPKLKFRGAQTMGVPTAHLLSIGAVVVAFLCVVGMGLYTASMMYDSRQISQPRGLSESEGGLSMGRLFDWFNDNTQHMKWSRDTDGGVGAVRKEVQPSVVEEHVGSLQKDADFVCPQCPICAELAPSQSEETIGPAKIQDPFPPVLDLYISQYPTISKFMRRWTDYYYDFLNAHLWIFLLLGLCGSWKIGEIFLVAGKAAEVRVRRRINDITEALQEQERLKKMENEKEERERREAEKKLMDRVAGMEKEKSTPLSEGDKGEEVGVKIE